MSYIKITGYDLIITGSCVSNKKIYYFSKKHIS